MNKKIKRTIAMALVVSAFAAVQPAKFNNVNLLMTEANAASAVYLDKLSVSGAGNVSLKKSKNKTYSVNVPRGNERATITITADSSSDIVEFDGEVLEPESSSSRRYKVKVDLDNKGSSANKFTINVTDKDGEKENEYTLKIYRKSSSKDDDDDDDDYDDIYLDDIVLSDGSIDFSKKKKSFDIEVPESVDEIKIKAKPEDDDYRVYIDGDEVDEDDKWRTTVDLSKGKNVIKIEIEDEDNDEERTYTLNIYRGTKASSSTTSSSKEDNTQDSIYLEDIVINSGEIDLGFNKKVTSYEFSVAESVDSIILKAIVDDEDDIIRLNGSKIKSEDRKRVQLEKGANTITVQVNNDEDKDDDDYEQRIYTIKVYRGVASEVVKPVEPSETPVQMNQWVNVMGKWKYYDSTGNPLSNAWLYDKNYKNYYYLDAEGFMSTGWLYNGGKWYYLNQSGAMMTGWLPLGDNWYYLDSSGAMVTGWFKDYSDGKWYYFDASGKMLKNTTVGRYRLGPSGAMI